VAYLKYLGSLGDPTDARTLHSNRCGRSRR